jgi:hypothetical protein
MSVTATFPFDVRTTEGFCLVTDTGRPIVATIRLRKKDVPRAAEEWSGRKYEEVEEFGYRIGKAWIITKMEPDQ